MGVKNEKNVNNKNNNYSVGIAIALIIIQGLAVITEISQPDRFKWESLASYLGYFSPTIIALIIIILALKSKREPKDDSTSLKKNHKGLDRVGIFIMYIMSGLFILSSLNSWIFWGYLMSSMAVSLLLGVTTLVLTFLYHTNKMTNYILVGIFGIFISIIGGIFILVGQPKTINNTKPIEDDNLSSLEYKLRQIDTLLTKGVLTKEEYDSKRQSIIEKTL